MARLLIGLTASETAPKAVDTVIEYAKMSAIGECCFDGADDLETALGAIFSDVNFTLPVKEVIICRSWPEATIVKKDGKRFSFSTLEPPADAEKVCRIDYRIGWQFFHNIYSRLESEKRMQELKPKIKNNEDVEAYRQYKLQIIKIGDAKGAAAAEEWIRKNPFKDEGQNQ